MLPCRQSAPAEHCATHGAEGRLDARPKVDDAAVGPVRRELHQDHEAALAHRGAYGQGDVAPRTAPEAHRPAGLRDPVRKVVPTQIAQGNPGDGGPQKGASRDAPKSSIKLLEAM